MRFKPLSHYVSAAVLMFFICWQSVSAADRSLQQFGSEIDGVRHVSAADAAQILKQYPSVRVLDVRTGFEFNRGHLANAININYYSFSFQRQLNELDKKVTWLVHCRTGVRSGKTLPIMKSLGFESIIHLDGGTVAWTNSGQPLQ